MNAEHWKLSPNELIAALINDPVCGPCCEALTDEQLKQLIEHFEMSELVNPKRKALA